MNHRLPHILVLCLVFGSLWLQGVFAMPSADHDMMGPLCLEHCLDALHLDDADDGLGVSSPSVVASPIREVPIPEGFLLTSSQRAESHHDPSQILTIQKRE